MGSYQGVCVGEGRWPWTLPAVAQREEQNGQMSTAVLPSTRYVPSFKGWRIAPVLQMGKQNPRSRAPGPSNWTSIEIFVSQ